MNETLDVIDAIRESDLESDNDVHWHMVDVPIAKEIASQLNEPDSLADHFAWLNSRLDSMNARLISYGEQFSMLNN